MVNKWLAEWHSAKSLADAVPFLFCHTSYVKHRLVTVMPHSGLFTKYVFIGELVYLNVIGDGKSLNIDYTGQHIFWCPRFLS